MENPSKCNCRATRRSVEAMPYGIYFNKLIRFSFSLLMFAFSLVSLQMPFALSFYFKNSWSFPFAFAVLLFATFFAILFLSFCVIISVVLCVRFWSLLPHILVLFFVVFNLLHSSLSQFCLISYCYMFVPLQLYSLCAHSLQNSWREIKETYWW